MKKQKKLLKLRIPVLERFIVVGAFASDKLGACAGGNDDSLADVVLL